MSNRIRAGGRFVPGTGGLLLPERAKVLQRGGRGATTVSNVATKRILPCCYAPCENDGNKNIFVDEPHEEPRWPGEKRVYIFCSDLCRREFVKGSRFENPDRV